MEKVCSLFFELRAKKSARAKGLDRPAKNTTTPSPSHEPDTPAARAVTHLLEKRSTRIPAGMPRTTLTAPETSITVPHCWTLRPMTSLARTIQKELTMDAKKTEEETRRERIQSLRGTSLRVARMLRYDSDRRPGILSSESSKV